MLKNYFFPVNFNKQISQICGEIICENLKEFFIYCKCCQIKMFEFEEFIHHFTNSHLDQVTEEISNPKHVNVQTESIGEDFENILKLEITEILEQKKTNDNKQNEENAWNQNNSIDFDDSKDYERTSEIDEAQSKSIIKKVLKSFDFLLIINHLILFKTRNEKEFSCKTCGKNYSSSRRLQVHITLVHLREKPFKCSLCEQTFAEERYLKNHKGLKHTGYECAECHKVFKTSSYLKRHSLVHVDKKEFVCNENNCGKAFASIGRLKSHQRYHSTESFICEECGFKCRKRESLVVHRRHHTGEKPFGCQQCDHRFGSKWLLKEHMASHETERKHVCDICGKSFNRPKVLYHHKHLHLGAKKFVCKLCGQAYAQAAGLSAHMRKHKENVASYL